MMVSFRRVTAILVCSTVSMLVGSCGGDSSSASPTSVVSTPATQSRPSADPRLPEGTYRTGTISLDQLIASGVAAGFNPAVVEKFYREHEGVSVSDAFTIKLQSGRWTQFGAVDGGPDEIGWAGRYKVLDDDTVFASEIGHPCNVTYTFKLADNQLSLTVASHNCSGVKAPEEDQIAQTTIYQSEPFTKIG